MNQSAYVWLGLVVLFAIAEAASLSLTSIWFAFGALLAMVAASLGASTVVQIVIFIFGSAILLLATKPLVKKFSLLKNEKTNSDRIIGQVGYVTEEINNLDAKGKIKILGQIWTARSDSGKIIPEGQTVRILRIEGVKAYVTIIEEET